MFNTGSAGPRRGLWIALYGPDGAGKSGVAERLAWELTPYFPAIRRHHLRAEFLGARIAATTVTQPHAQTPRGVLLSCVKLQYLLLRCWLAHLVLVLPRVAAGELVIFDRYFGDYAIDPHRYRLPYELSFWAAVLSRFAPRPHRQFVLDVPGTELQRRKREVTPDESLRQRHAYVERLGRASNTIIISANRPISDVAGEIGNEILRLLQERNARPAEADVARA
jgi:thymidylate kinase